jgi:hypothetical protein
MKGMLRNHPKMRFGGASSWPPQCAGASDAYTEFPVGEQGTLKAVELLPADDTRPARLSLTNEYRGRFFPEISRSMILELFPDSLLS